MKSEREMRKALGHGWLWILLLLIFLWLPEAIAEVKPRFIILPFLIEREPVCPICRRVFQRGEILPGSQNTLTRILYSKIDARGIFILPPLEKVEEAFSNWERKKFEEKPLSSSIQFGKELQGDYILIGFVFRYEERVGSSVGVEKPASVAFDFHLFRLRDGMEVWRGRMDETQRPLSENLLRIGSFIRGKARWLTAEELSSIGLDEALRSLPGIKELEEK